MRFWRVLVWGIIGLFCLEVISGEFSFVYAGKSGGRFGGRSGFSRSRSLGSPGSPGRLSQPAPSGSPGRYSGGYGYTPSPIGGYGGFPLFFWGGGGGGRSLFSSPLVLILLGLVVIYFLISLREKRRYAYPEEEPSAPPRQGVFTMLKLQLALLPTARFIQQELEQLASHGDTSTPEGLATLLQETAVLLSRHPEYWRYGSFEVRRAGTLDEAEEIFQEMVAQERAKLSTEVIQNIEGRLRRKSPERREEEGVNEFIVVTVIVATQKRHFASLAHPSYEDIARILSKMGAIISHHLLALEVIWTPATPGDVLTEEEILLEYRDLQSLSV